MISMKLIIVANMQLGLLIEIKVKTFFFSFYKYNILL